MPVIGKKTAKGILDLFDDVREFAQRAEGPFGARVAPLIQRMEPLYLAVSDAIETKRHVKLARKRKQAKREAHNEEISGIRNEVWKRSNDRCEHCGAILGAIIGEMDHAFGGSSKQQFESVEGCWRLCHRCHRRKTNNYPARSSWLQAFVEHCQRQIQRVCESSVVSFESGALHLGYLKMIDEAQRRLEGCTD